MADIQIHSSLWYLLLIPIIFVWGYANYLFLSWLWSLAKSTM